MPAPSRHATPAPPEIAWPAPAGDKARAPWRIRLLRGIEQELRSSATLRGADPHLLLRVALPADSPPVTGGPLARLAAGDARAMESCIDAFGPLVWGIVLKRVRDRAAAE